MWPQWLAEALHGRVSLSRAFWLYGLGVSVVYSLIGLLVDVQNLPVAVAYLVVGLALGVLQTIILWRSASNSRSKFLGGLVHSLMVLGFILVALMLYVLLTNWHSLAAF